MGNIFPSSRLAVLLRLLRSGSPESCLDAAQHLGVKQSPHKDHERAQPVPRSEGVLEVNDGEDEAEELS